MNLNSGHPQYQLDDGLPAVGDAVRPRPGWYAYQAGPSAEMPPWTVEVALTIERPAGPDPYEPRLPDDAGPTPYLAGPIPPPEPEGDEGWIRATGPPASHAPLPERPAEALLLVRAPSRMRLFEGLAAAAVEIEAAAGLRSTVDPQPAPGLRPPTRLGSILGRGQGRPSAGMRTGAGSRLLVGRGLPGLTPVTPAAALAHLEAAGARGLPAPMRRRQPAVGSVGTTWRSSAGSVLTCEGPSGTSAQVVIALRGLGNSDAITPPSGGALVLRAWKAGPSWGLACGLVLGAAGALGLGREAGRVAADARAEGWDAVVLNGLTALHLAWAGNPGNPPPEACANAASDARVAAMVGACLAAGGVDHPTTDSQWVLAVTP